MALIASADENVIATLEADAAKLATELLALDAEESQLSSMREALAGRKTSSHSLNCTTRPHGVRCRPAVMKPT
jgi:hypothetical protein